MSAMLNSPSANNTSGHRSRNSFQGSVLSSLWNDDNANDATKEDSSVISNVPAVNNQPPVVNSPSPEPAVLKPAIVDTFQAPTSSIENLRRAAPGVRSRITSLENEVHRSKSPLDKLKEQQRLGNTRKLSQEYEAARSKWAIRANDDTPVRPVKPLGLRTLGSTISIASVGLERTDSNGLPMAKSDVILKSNIEIKKTVPTPDYGKAGKLASLIGLQASDFELHNGDKTVSPVASSCYSVTVPETQTTVAVVESKRQVSLMSNMSQYNVGTSLYGTDSRPGSRALFPKESVAEKLGKKDVDVVESPKTTVVPEGPITPDDSIVEPESAPEVMSEAVPENVSEPVSEPASEPSDGQLSRASSRYSHASVLEKSPKKKNPCRDSGKWTELTELTVPSIDLDKDQDATRFDLSFPETTEYVPNEPEVIHHGRPHSREQVDGAAENSAPKKSVLGSVFGSQRSSSNRRSEFRKSWPLAALSAAHDPVMATKDAIARSASVMSRRAPDTSLEGQASGLSQNRLEPSSESSEPSVYGYMTPTQKAIHLMKKMAHPIKWAQAKKEKAAKNKQFATSSPITSPRGSDFPQALAPLPPAPNAATTVTTVEALKREKSTRDRFSKRASWMFSRDSRRKSRLSGASASPAPSLPVIHASQQDELAQRWIQAVNQRLEAHNL